MLAVMFGLFAALCWSLHDLLARSLATNVGPYRMAVVTLLAGAALLAGIVMWNGQLAFGQSGIATALWMGLIYGIAIGSLFVAFSLAPVSIVGPFTAGYPALIVLWGIYNGLVPTFAQDVAIVAIVLGAIIVGRMGPADGGLAVLAPGKFLPLVFFCALASTCFATALIMGQTAAAKIGEFETTFLSRLPAALVLTPLAWRERPDKKSISPPTWVGLIAMGALDVMAVSGVNYMGRLPNKEFGAMGISAYAATAVILALIILKEKTNAWQWLGIGLIVSGVAVLGSG